MFQFDNLLKFNYVGYPDEIIQTFDAGNVTFNTPSKYIGLQQDLFGLKAVSRFGPVYVTTMPAQKKGERQSKTFGGGGAGQAAEHLVRPWEYRRNRFFLDTSYIKYYEPYCATIPRDPRVVINQAQEYVPAGLKGNDIQVWTMTRNATAELKKQAVAWYHLPTIGNTGRYADSYRSVPTTQDPNNQVQAGYWLKMDSTRYTYDPYTGILILNQEPEDQETALAVSYPVYQGNSPIGRYGEQGDAGDIIVLKLIKPIGTFKTTGNVAWRNIVKNTYYVGGQSFTEKDFGLRIMYQTPRGGQDEYMKTAGKGMKKQTKAITIMGLDRYQNTNPGDASPD